METTVVLAVILILCVSWVYQFVQLMLLTETGFPGKHDKGHWTAAFILAFAVALFAFFGWKHACRAMLTGQAAAGPQKP